MAKANVDLLAFNRGVISPLALARTDLDRTRLSAEVQTNYIPRTLGSMMLRPGTEYISSTKDNNTARYIPFIYATDDQAYIEMSDSNMRVYIDDATITRASVSASFTNGTFDSNVNGWTDADETGAASSWQSGGYLALLGTGFEAAIRRQQITVTETGTLHGIRVTVQRGPVTIKCGSTSGNDDYFSETLETGTHSLAFTPTGNFWIDLQSTKDYTVLVDSIAIESSGTQDLPSPYAEADLNSIRWDQSADVIFLACPGYKQRKIIRRGTTSWSIVEYIPEDGPFRAINTSTITMTPGAISGDTTVTSSEPFFKATNVGGLIRIESIGQTVTLTGSGGDQFTDPIRVTGVENSRIFDIDITGLTDSTVTIQRSVAEPGDWSDVSGLSYTTNQDTTHDDDLDNQIIYYRIGIKSGDYGTDSPVMTLSYGSGSNTGIALITAFNSTTSVDVVVLNPFGNTDASSNWYEGQWSDRRGFPSAVAFHESRLAWAGKSKVWLSVTDAFDVFDDTIEGDSGPISRSIGQGPVDGVNWIFAAQRLVLGTDGSEASIRSTSFDEPLTPTAFNIKFPSTQGSANVPIVKVDQTGIFVQRGQTSVYKLVYSEATSYDYTSGEVTTLVPSIGEPSIERMAAQRQPDTRIHCVRGDGKVAIWLNDPAEDVSCWVLFETDGEVEDVFVMPTGTVEDRVYYLVKRTVDGNTVRYLEKWALESECQGGTQNKQADSFITYSGASTTSITGLTHLEGESVVVWGDGAYNGTYTVSSGAITLDTAITSGVIGLGYTAQFKSAKLAYATDMGSPLTQKKIIPQLGLIMYNTYKDGVKYGSDFSNLDDLPQTEEGTDVADGTLHSSYDEMAFTFNGTWDTDSRLCLQSQAPKPCTVLAAVVGIRTNEKI